MIRELKTSRLVLEPLEVRHACFLFADLQHPALYEWIPCGPPASLEELERRYERLVAGRSDDGREAWLNWAAWSKDLAAYVGLIEATVRTESALLAYFTFPRFRRQGFAREGCEEVFRFLAEACEVRDVIAEIDTRNDASIALVESLGFRRIATERNADFFNGSPSHEYCYMRRLDRQ